MMALTYKTRRYGWVLETKLNVEHVDWDGFTEAEAKERILTLVALRDALKPQPAMGNGQVIGSRPLTCAQCGRGPFVNPKDLDAHEKSCMPHI